jgi:O-antigen/teichoic acid export membrane protein
MFLINKILKPNGAQLYNIAVQIGLRCFILFFGLILNRWLVSNLADEVYREYSLIADSINTLVFALISFAIPNILQKIYTNLEFNSKNKEHLGKVWSTFFFVRIFSYFVGLVFLVLITQFIKVDSLPLAISIYSIQFLLIIDLSYRAICYAINNAWKFFLTDLVGKFLLVVALYSLPLVFTDLVIGIEFFIFLSGTSYLFSLIVDVIWQRKYTPFVWELDWSILKLESRAIFLLVATSVVGFFYLTSFQTVFGLFDFETVDVNGFTNAYNRVFLTISTVPAIIMPSIATKVTRLINSKNHQKVKNYLQYTILFGILLFLGSLLLGNVILSLIDPEGRYPAAFSLFSILSLAMIIYPMVFLLSDVFIFLHKEKYQLFTASSLAVMGIIFQLVLISQFGVYGAAWALVLTMFSDLVIKLLLLYRLVKVKKIFL